MFPRPCSLLHGLRCDQRDSRGRRAEALQLPHVLRAVPAPARHRDLEVRLPDQRIERPDGQRKCRSRRIAPRRAIEFLRAAGGVAQQIKGLAGENRGNLVVTVAVRRGPRKHGDDDLRPKPADHIEDVFEDRVARPEPKGFVGGLGVAEVVRPREELARAASSSSVRMIPSSGPSSGPMRFWPPSPRVSERYPACAPMPRDRSTNSCVSSSSGCAPIMSTRLLLPSCRNVVANAVTPPVPDGVICPRNTPTAPKLSRSPTTHVFTIGKGTRRHPS